MRGEHQAAFEHLRDDFGGASLQQAIELRVVERAHDHRQIGALLAHVMQDFQRRGRIGKRYRDRARLVKPRGDQRFAAPCIAVDDVRPIGGFAHALGIGIECEIRNILGLEQASEILSAAAVAAMMMWSRRDRRVAICVTRAPRQSLSEPAQTGSKN
jgi:hypothetical protein